MNRKKLLTIGIIATLGAAALFGAFAYGSTRVASPVQAAPENRLALQMPDRGVGDGSTLRFFSVTDFADTIRVDGKLSLRVRIASDTDPLGLARNLDISPAKISALFDLPDSMMTDGPSSASGFHSLTEYLVDIETLLILRESQRREVVALVPSRDGRTVVTRVSESLDKVFDFDR